LLVRGHEVSEDQVMVLVFAGRRPGTDDFPEVNADFVSSRLRQLIEGLRPRAVVGSAAAGSDLLTIQAALNAQASVKLFLAGSQHQFRESSVADKGDRWVRVFDSVLASPKTTVNELALSEDSDDSYRAVTEAIMEQARSLAGVDEAVMAVVAATPREDGVDHSEELAQRCVALGHLVLRVDPAAEPSSVPQAFVAMPFGNKTVDTRGWNNYDADLTYHRVLMPALIDAGYRPMRADTDALLEIIDHKMLTEINRSELMVADLATLNPNVMWELGLRHAWRKAGTVLVMLKGMRRPFDVDRIPVYEYQRGEREMADGEVKDILATLQRVLSEVGERQIDSPVFANLGGLEEVVLEGLPTADVPQTAATELLTSITWARDLGDLELMSALLQEIVEGHLSGQQKGTLLEQIGVSLIALDRYAEAVEVLGPLATADATFQRPELQQRYAHALIRSPNDAGQDERLAEAERRLEAMRAHGQATSETLGLLGSAAKHRIHAQVQDGQMPASVEVDRAIDAYRRGFESDPGDYYPGINLVALLRLDAQHWRPRDGVLVEARNLLPVVRFAVTRSSSYMSDTWAVLTLAECALHDHLLDAAEARLARAADLYAQAGARLTPQQRRSARTQLDLFKAAGDDVEIIDEAGAGLAS
jgi:hypothetical protein